MADVGDLAIAIESDRLLGKLLAKLSNIGILGQYRK